MTESLPPSGRLAGEPPPEDLLPVRNSVAAFLSRLSEGEVEYLLATVAGLQPEIFTLFYLRHCHAEREDPFNPDYTQAAQMVGALLREMFRGTGERCADVPYTMKARLLTRHIDEHPDGWLCFCWPVACGMLARLNTPPETVSDIIGMQTEIGQLWVALLGDVSPGEPVPPEGERKQ